MTFSSSGRWPGVIIADATPDLIRVYEKSFELAGLQVLASFSDGRALLDFFSALSDDSVKQKVLSYNSIVILDYRMMQERRIEEGMRKIRKINPKQKIILTTIEDPRYSDLSGFGDVFDAILRKPFTIKELIRILNYLSSSRIPSALRE